MGNKVYLVTMKHFMDTYLMGVFSSREKAEEQRSRVEGCINRISVFAMLKMDAIIEADLDSTTNIDEVVDEFEKELAE